MTSETSATSHVPFLQSDLQLDTSRVSESEDDWVRREGRTKLSQEKSDKTVYSRPTFRLSSSCTEGQGSQLSSSK